jgi:hypothetical protein
MQITTFIEHEKFEKIKNKHQSFSKKAFDDNIELIENNLQKITSAGIDNDYYFLEGSILVLENDTYIDFRYHSLIFSTWDAYISASISYLEKKESNDDNLLPEMAIDLRIKTFDSLQITIEFYYSQEDKTDTYIYNAKSFFTELTQKCGEFLSFMKIIFNNNADFDYLSNKNKRAIELISKRYKFS